MLLSAKPTVGRPARRRGTIVALLALTIVALVAFLGLAIDIGMLSIAKTQAQNAADLAALAAARTLTGDPSTTYNNANATTNAQNILGFNVILGQPIPSSQLTLTYGSFDYNQTTQSFNANFPPTTGQPYTAVNATVTMTGLPGAFSTVLGNQFLPNVSATAQAVHRPRDIGLVMDLSGSMRFGTCLGFDFYTNSRTSNNPDPLIPTFGHYSSGSATMKGPSTNQTSGVDSYTISPSNTTAPNSSYTLTYVNNFYQNAAYAPTLIRAFDSYTSTDGGTTWNAPTSGAPQLPPASYASVPGGDVPLFLHGSTVTYAQTVNDVVNGAARNPWWELDGYSGCTNGSFNNADMGVSSYPKSGNGAFYGYTKGPGYYGKTFFIWPPDPRRPLNSTLAADATQIKTFLQDFGYNSATDFSNTAFKTTLTANITNAQTTITVASGASFPTSPFSQFRIIVNGSEHMLVTAVAGTTWTVSRHVDGTAAAAATSGKTVALVTKEPLLGIYGVTTTPSSQNWPWPNDTGTALSTYLTSQVYTPVSLGATARLLKTTDAVYQKIMRLYNWNYVIDNTGTTACDWRLRFFATDDNTVLFNGSGSLNPPGSPGMCPALQTYNAILTWLTQTTDPFPAQLRAGRIKYYGSIPTTITGTWPSYGGTDQRFWVEVIDYVLGYRQTSAGAYTDVSAMAGYGSDFTWGSVVTNTPPASETPYMNYLDNPARPLLRHWFGPLLLVDYLHNYNMASHLGNYFYTQPGDSYEAPIYTGREAFLAAINTMQMNHPNDWVTFAPYSWPRNAAKGGFGRFNCVRCPLGTNYAYASSALLFPFSTINADGSPNNTEVTPYDADPATTLIPSANFVDTPRADGDTCFAMALMLCYNQFAVTTPSDTTLRSFVTTSPITFPSGMAGGMGRKGAQKVIIFETDGLANCGATAGLVNAGSYNYYQIRYDMNKPTSSEYPAVNASFINDPTVLNQVYSLVDQLKADYGSSRSPFRLYAIGFGPVFSGPDANAALTTLQTMQFHAGTQSSASTPLAPNQIITGNDATMSSNMIATFTSILQNGVQIALIK